MDFQGQGLVTSGETEALALIYSFTKTVLLTPLPDRKVTTLNPRTSYLVCSMSSTFVAGRPTSFARMMLPNFSANSSTPSLQSPARTARPPAELEHNNSRRENGLWNSYGTETVMEHNSYDKSFFDES
jgi:hypothetical protein